MQSTVHGELYDHEDGSSIGWRCGDGDDDYYITDGTTVLYWEGIAFWEVTDVNEDLFEEWLGYVGDEGGVQRIH